MNERGWYALGAERMGWVMGQLILFFIFYFTTVIKRIVFGVVYIGDE